MRPNDCIELGVRFFQGLGYRDMARSTDCRVGNVYEGQKLTP